MKVDLNQRMRKTREEKGYSQKKLAELAGVSPGSMSAYELGNKKPPVDVAARIAAVLGVSVDWLFGTDTDRGGLQRPRSYGDLVKMILIVTESIDPMYLGTYDVEWREDSRLEPEERKVYQEREKELILVNKGNEPVNVTYFIMENRDKVLVNFFQSWRKLMDIRNQGILDDEVYGAWLEKKLNELSKTPLAAAGGGAGDGSVSGKGMDLEK